MENNKEKHKLEVGDVVYRYSYSDLVDKYTITRVTKTKAVAGHVAFKRDYFNDYVCDYSPSRWSSNHYYIETEELKKDWERKELIRKLEYFKFENLSTEQLKEFIEKYYKEDSK